MDAINYLLSQPANAVRLLTSITELENREPPTSARQAC